MKDSLKLEVARKNRGIIRGQDKMTGNMKKILKMKAVEMMRKMKKMWILKRIKNKVKT